MTQRFFTIEQQSIVDELCQQHGLAPSQISFDEAGSTTPIFDYEAVCLLSLRLTNLPDIDCWVAGRELATGISTAKCKITLADGRTRTIEDTAYIGEVLGNGFKIDNVRSADNQAQNRATRRGIRSVGINLYNAHLEFMRSGKQTAGNADYDPRRAVYAELHALATEADLIVDGDKSGYRRLMAEMNDGIESATGLNDIQLKNFLVCIRAMVGAQRYKARMAA